ncbi:MAG TPA: hypothetical protein VHH36_03220 [Candidatus Thermoplasmatota archaeon]|nr:hypothetical protein [Candidatus Thermoplasmatota archaeon]
MRFMKLAQTLAALALVGVVFTTLVPTAAAQTQQPVALTLKIEPQRDQALKPLQQQITLRGTVEFAADAATPRTSFTGIQVQLTKTTGPGWATVVFNPPTLVLTFDAPAGAEQQATASGTFDMVISASDQAPAFQDTEIVVQAKSASSQAFQEKTATASVSVHADYFSILDIALPESIKVERPQTPAAFPITITNFGNGPTKVNFEIEARPENEKFTIIPPSSIQLESKQVGGSQITKDAILQVQTPYKNGYMNEPGAVTVKITSHYATDSTLVGASDKVTVLVTTKGFYVPGPSPVLLIGLLAIAAFVLRRRSA